MGSLFTNICVLKGNNVVWSNVKQKLPVLNIVNTAIKARSIQNVKSTGRFITLSVITNIYNKKIEGPTLMELCGNKMPTRCNR